MKNETFQSFHSVMIMSLIVSEFTKFHFPSSDCILVFAFYEQEDSGKYCTYLNSISNNRCSIINKTGSFGFHCRRNFVQILLQEIQYLARLQLKSRLTLLHDYNNSHPRPLNTEKLDRSQFKRYIHGSISSRLQF